MGKLRNGEYAFLRVFLNLLLSHAPNEAEAVLADSLVVAALAELTDLAVFI